MMGRATQLLKQSRLGTVDAKSKKHARMKSAYSTSLLINEGEYFELQEKKHRTN